jgi:hypothetical protein
MSGWNIVLLLSSQSSVGIISASVKRGLGFVGQVP